MSERRPMPVSHDEAREILSRFNASHWRNDGRERARYTIPCDVNRDDDCLMDQYIAEQRAKDSRIRELEEAVRVLGAECRAWARLDSEFVIEQCIDDAIEDSSERGGWGRAEWQESRQQRAKMFGELLASQKDVQNNPIAAEACKERSK